MNNKYNTSRRSSRAMPAFTLTPIKGNKVRFQPTKWLLQMLGKASRPVVDGVRWMREQATHNFEHGFVVRDNRGRVIYKNKNKKVAERVGGRVQMQNKLERANRVLAKTDNVRTHNPVPATITRTKNGAILKYTARDGSVKQRPVNVDDSAPVVSTTVLKGVDSNKVYDVAQLRFNTPFAPEQNLGFHLVKIGYC